MDKSNVEWWEPSKILGYNCIFNIVESLRGGGKTYGCLKFFINRFKKKGEQFFYLRRYQEDIDFIKFNLFNNLEMDDVIKPSEFRIKGNKIIYNSKGVDKSILANIRNNNKLTQKQKESLIEAKVDTAYDEVCGIALSLTDVSRAKSAGLQNICWGVFEEYIDENNEYLPNEVNRFMSLYESIDRSRDALRVFLLGNKISNINPFYDFMDVKFDPNARITCVKGKSICLERFQSQSVLDYKSRTRFAKALEGTQYGDFMQGLGLLDDDQSITFIDTSKLDCQVNILTELGTFGVYQTGDNVYFGKKREGVITLNGTKDYIAGMTFLKAIEFYKTLKELWKNGKLLFHSIKSFNSINNLF